MSSTTDTALPLPVSSGSQSGVTISDSGQPNDNTKAPIVFLGDPNTGKKAWDGAITLLAAPTVTGGNPLAATTDGNVVFSQQARQVLVRNLTAYDVYMEPDAVASTASWPVLAGETQIIDMLVTTLHLYPTGAISVNVANGFYVRGGV